MATVASIVIHDAKNNDIRYYKKEKGYNLMKNFGFFWTSTESNYNKAWLFYLTTNNNMISTDQLSKTIGASVRCIQD